MIGFFNEFFFGVMPYICLAVMTIATIIRYDREPYSWRAASSQIMGDKGLRLGNKLFHIGVIFLFFGHFAGLLTPHSVYHHFISAENKQMVAIFAGGIAGTICFVGLTILCFRRLFVARVRVTSAPADIAILLILWVQLVLGLTTIPYSLEHSDGSVMMALSEWCQRIITFRGADHELIEPLAWPYKAHLILGMFIFLLFPFTRLVHIISAPIRYIWRPYQVVRSRFSRR
jgi:nitrate reductase gamma subunit